MLLLHCEAAAHSVHFSRTLRQAETMDDVKLTELRQRLPAYLKEVEKGRTLRITSRGRVVARLLPPEDTVEAALARLKALRKTARIGDVIAPTGERWRAERAGP
jgi:prevent-host-death family protein